MCWAAGTRHDAEALIASHRDDGLAGSLLTLGELYEGIYGSPNPTEHVAALADVLALFDVLPLADSTMHQFARLRAVLRPQGTLIPDLDLLIAGTALEHDLVLMTWYHRSGSDKQRFVPDSRARYGDLRAP